MLNDDFLLSISGHSYHDRQRRLTSPSLEGVSHDTFSMRIFVNVIQRQTSHRRNRLYQDCQAFGKVALIQPSFIR